MEEQLLVALAGIVVLGVTAQWVAWRYHLPSILLLLLAGFVAGPVGHVIDPDALLGDMLFPFVSLSVGIILFEGGLSLKFAELREGAGQIVGKLVTVGVLITWLLGAAAAYYVAGTTGEIAFILGAILVVSGPTVVVPLLLHVRPERRIGGIVKWEGIVNDPIGAVLAVLVFYEVVSGHLQHGVLHMLEEMTRTTIIGGAVGILGAVFLVQLLRRHLVPEYLQNPIVLALVVGDFAFANILQTEAGLLAVTVMGIAVANQSYVPVKQIVEFKETLRTLLISTLFIVLAARIELDVFAAVELRHALFVALMMFVIRPIAVAASTVGAPLSWREKLFLVWMAPRGIVAAAVASLFALELHEHGIAGGDALVTLTFLVIGSTVAIYGLTAGPLAKVLGLVQPGRDGFLILGAHPWAIDLAAVLKHVDLPVLLVDTNKHNIAAAGMRGLDTYQGNLLSNHALEEINLGRIGHLLALTPNDEVNTLAVLQVREVFDHGAAFQLYMSDAGESERFDEALRGRELFGEGLCYRLLQERYDKGAQFRVLAVGDIEEHAKMMNDLGADVTPLFRASPATGRVEIFTVESKPEVVEGDFLIVLADQAALYDDRFRGRLTRPERLTIDPKTLVAEFDSNDPIAIEQLIAVTGKRPDNAATSTTADATPPSAEGSEPDA